MTCKAIYYFSLTGNTKSILENVTEFDVYDIEELNSFDFNSYDTILVGLPTYGRSDLHKNTWEFAKELLSVSGKNIGLFGSGNSIYPDFCGALDELEKILKVNNNILFNFKFEGYPTDKAKREFVELINKL